MIQAISLMADNGVPRLSDRDGMDMVRTQRYRWLVRVHSGLAPMLLFSINQHQQLAPYGCKVSWEGNKHTSGTTYRRPQPSRGGMRIMDRSELLVRTPSP